MEHWSKKLCHSIGLPLNLGISIFGSLAWIWLLFCWLEEALSKSLALEFVGLVVDGKARQVSILVTKSCILSWDKKKYCSFLYQIFQLELIQESHYLIVLFVYLFSYTLILYDFSFDIWSKFPGTNSFKDIIISFSSLLKWPFYVALLLFFFDRTPFPEGASSLPLRDIPPKRQLKPQTNKKKTNYFLINQQNRKIKVFFKTVISQRTWILLWLPQSQLIGS